LRALPCRGGEQRDCAFYYFKVIRVMYLMEPEKETTLKYPPPRFSALGFTGGNFPVRTFPFPVAAMIKGMLLS